MKHQKWLILFIVLVLMGGTAGALTWLDFALLALKSLIFGFFIAIVTCYHGLAQPLQLADVSRVTVRAVTQGVIVCVLIDALFILLYLVA